MCRSPPRPARTPCRASGKSIRVPSALCREAAPLALLGQHPFREIDALLQLEHPLVHFPEDLHLFTQPRNLLRQPARIAALVPVHPADQELVDAHQEQRTDAHPRDRDQHDDGARVHYSPPRTSLPCSRCWARIRSAKSSRSSSSCTRPTLSSSASTRARSCCTSPAPAPLRSAINRSWRRSIQRMTTRYTPNMPRSPMAIPTNGNTTFWIHSQSGIPGGIVLFLPRRTRPQRGSLPLLGQEPLREILALLQLGHSLSEGLELRGDALRVHVRRGRTVRPRRYAPDGLGDGLAHGPTEDDGRRGAHKKGDGYEDFGSTHRFPRRGRGTESPSGWPPSISTTPVSKSVMMAGIS